ncbi:endonuclease/exonuclease/phosphatase family protein [Aridibaculum aurantiacum]|uniref:endonuclease/exonuclease/phosphatase family protein n=1 Tax=Aridibaculum aurantiacum TaxID=2810307 RepID=UPI001A97368F|nr:endonuclease/exonuclease/phosphatase family protein [Aridibaculum aurantiacum]
MPSLTIATFNCENLFRRYKFSDKLPPGEVNQAVENGFIINSSRFTTVPQPERKLTAKVIRDTKADIIALQEVENLDTLKNFCAENNLSSLYPYKLLVDGNDPRLIDVAVLSKLPFERIMTHQYLRNSKKNWLFSRDCLELDFMVEGKPFILYKNHLKSMFDMSNPANGRAISASRRIEQVDGILKIVQDRLKRRVSTAAFAIVGDFNDYPSEDSSLEKLFKTKWLYNVVENLPAEERWTHFWDTTKVQEADRYSQLDYVWLSKRLVKANPGVLPVINRKGLSKKAQHPLIKSRYPEIINSNETIAASDHCSVSVTISF